MFVKFFGFLIILQVLNSVYCVHKTIEEAKAAREVLVKKHLKRLKKEEGAIKLVGGRNEYEGNVEILHLGKWGAICDDEWDKKEAEVVCRQLGFSGVESVTHSGIFGPAKRKYWMDNMYCDGKETELSKCRFDGWGNSDCDPSEAAGVICKDDKKKTEIAKIDKTKIVKKPKYRITGKGKMEIRLVGGRSKEEGRIEVRVGKSHWGTICSDGWSLLEANVVCRSLNYGYATEAFQTDFFGGNHSKLILTGTECFGNETSLAECRHHEYGIDNFCPGPKNHIASVVCTEIMADLVFDYGELERSAHLEDRQLYLLQCAMEENCLASTAYQVQRDNNNWHLETRRLLKFTASVLNSGNADFRPSIPKHLWEWHMCHMHYHSMEVFATFNIMNHLGEKVAEGHKASFCLEDNQCNPGVKKKYACANYGDQGISVNCTDIYHYNLDCQWVDITEMDYGVYTMKISVNPEFKVPEMSFDNNAALCTLLYTQTYARVYNCRLERP